MTIDGDAYIPHQIRFLTKIPNYICHSNNNSSLCSYLMKPLVNRFGRKFLNKFIGQALPCFSLTSKKSTKVSQVAEYVVLSCDSDFNFQKIGIREVCIMLNIDTIIYFFNSMKTQFTLLGTKSCHEFLFTAQYKILTKVGITLTKLLKC